VHDDAFVELPCNSKEVFALAAWPDDVLADWLTVYVLQCAFKHDLLELGVVDLPDDHLLLLHLVGDLDKWVVEMFNVFALWN
jgi:hypothetical protein